MEDSPTDTFVIRSALRSCPFEFDLQVMTDGQAAISRIGSVENDVQIPAPDLILLDLNLPKASGIQVLQHLRTALRCSGTPVVVVTSSDSESDLQAVRALGIAAYFRKPHDLDEFMRLSEVVSGALYK